MADRSVIKIVGTIYEVKQARFWKGKNKQSMPGVEVGSFVARKRIQAKDRIQSAGGGSRGSHRRSQPSSKQMEQNEYDDYYDDYDGYDDYDEIGEEGYDEYDD